MNRMISPDYIEKTHNLGVTRELIDFLLNNPESVGMSKEELQGKSVDHQSHLLIGEYFIQIAKHIGKEGSKLLFKGQWGFQLPDWFDHRHHLLDTEKYFKDFWTLSADNVLRVLPLNGRLLSLCTGDGFYDYYFYRERCAEIVCVDINRNCYNHFQRLYRAPNIQYILHDLLSYNPEKCYYDTVVIRGAIEHFSEVNQQKIFILAKSALKSGGWFCGDTPQATGRGLGHEAHQYEWRDEKHMREVLERVFSRVETFTFVSKEHTTLFWRCQSA